MNVISLPCSVMLNSSPPPSRMQITGNTVLKSNFCLSVPCLSAQQHAEAMSALYVIIYVMLHDSRFWKPAGYPESGKVSAQQGKPVLISFMQLEWVRQRQVCFISPYQMLRSAFAVNSSESHCLSDNKQNSFQPAAIHLLLDTSSNDYQSTYKQREKKACRNIGRVQKPAGN